MEPVARRLYRLVEPIHLVTYFSTEPTEALMALGYRNYWDGYFAGRAAPLGRVPAAYFGLFYAQEHLHQTADPHELLRPVLEGTLRERMELADATRGPW